MSNFGGYFHGSGGRVQNRDFPHGFSQIPCTKMKVNPVSVKFWIYLGNVINAYLATVSCKIACFKILFQLLSYENSWYCDSIHTSYNKHISALVKLVKLKFRNSFLGNMLKTDTLIPIIINVNKELIYLFAMTDHRYYGLNNGGLETFT